MAASSCRGFLRTSKAGAQARPGLARGSGSGLEPLAGLGVVALLVLLALMSWPGPVAAQPYPAALSSGQLLEYSRPGPYRVAQRTVTITRVLTSATPPPTDVRGQTFTAALYYPAAGASGGYTDCTGAADARSCPPLAAGPAVFYPLAWAVGWTSWPDRYLSTISHLASHGFILIAPHSTDRNPAPYFDEYSYDLLDAIQWLLADGGDPRSVLYGRVGASVGLIGHSSGSGTLMRAAAENHAQGFGLPLTALFALTPAYQVAMSVTPTAGGGWDQFRADLLLPMLVLDGTEDTFTAPDTIYALFSSAVNARVLAMVRGGSHCYVDPPWDYTSQCLALDGSGAYSTGLPPSTQLAELRWLSTAWFKLMLDPGYGDDPALNALIWGGGLSREALLTRVQVEPGIGVSTGLPPAARIVISPGGAPASLPGTVTSYIPGVRAADVLLLPEDVPPGLRVSVSRGQRLVITSSQVATANVTVAAGSDSANGAASLLLMARAEVSLAGGGGRAFARVKIDVRPPGTPDRVTPLPSPRLAARVCAPGGVCTAVLEPESS